MRDERKDQLILQSRFHQFDLNLYLDLKVVEVIKKKTSKKGYNGYKKFAEEILYEEVKEDIEK